MFQNLYPKEEQDSVYTLDYESLYEKGYRGIIFDIDNTLVEHGAPATKEAIALVDRLRRMGFSVCFLSNNDKPRVSEFCKPMEELTSNLGITEEPRPYTRSTVPIRWRDVLHF